jgi:hypothetical protein
MNRHGSGSGSGSTAGGSKIWRKGFNISSKDMRIMSELEVAYGAIYAQREALLEELDKLDGNPHVPLPLRFSNPLLDVFEYLILSPR